MCVRARVRVCARVRAYVYMRACSLLQRGRAARARSARLFGGGRFVRDAGDHGLVPRLHLHGTRLSQHVCSVACFC